MKPLDLSTTLILVLILIVGISIPSLDKVVFLGNRRFLPSNHELRKNRRNFPWNQKEESPTPEQTISEDLLWDAVTHSKAPNKTQAANITKATGSKGVNCFMLLPDHDRPKQAFPDMMHTLRNVVVSFFDLITGRGDAVKVRNGEKEVNRFKECWVNGNDSNTGELRCTGQTCSHANNIQLFSMCSFKNLHSSLIESH